MANDKRLDAIRQNPKNVRPSELDTVLRAAGFSVRQKGTSHRYYTRGKQRLSVPQHRPHLKATYVKRAIALLDAEDA